MARITITGTGQEFDCAEDDTVMRAALRAGLGFPYECNVGSCGNCRFELVDGAVEHVHPAPPAWSERDRQRNRFLGCQARPRGDCTIKVRLDGQYRSPQPPRRTTARLTGVADVTHDIREFRLAPAEPMPFRPGQYMLLQVPGADGPRAYSMCNVAADGAECHFQIKRVPDGSATTRLFEGLPEGATVGLDGPYGMAYLREDAPRDILCLAGGSGLSPMIAIARAAAASPALGGRGIHFLYGGRAPRDICGRPFLEALPGFGTRVHYVPSVSDAAAGDGWTGRTGFLHEVARDMFGERLRDFEIYFAGPPPMVAAVQRMLFELQVPPDQIHFDQFY